VQQSPLAVHHVGVAVTSIDEALRFYGDKLGLSVCDRLDLPERQLKVAFIQAANVLIELLEPTATDTPVARFLERRGPGLHHLCFGTADIREHLRDLKDKGVRQPLEIFGDDVDRHPDDVATGLLGAARDGFHDTVVATGDDAEAAFGKRAPKLLRGKIFIRVGLDT